jgi:hypothetical protein
MDVNGSDVPRFKDGTIWQEGMTEAWDYTHMNDGVWTTNRYDIDPPSYHVYDPHRGSGGWVIKTESGSRRLEYLYPSRSASIRGRMQEEQTWADSFLEKVRELGDLLAQETARSGSIRPEPLFADGKLCGYLARGSHDAKAFLYAVKAYHGDREDCPEIHHASPEAVKTASVLEYGGQDGHTTFMRAKDDDEAGIPATYLLWL